MIGNSYRFPIVQGGAMAESGNCREFVLDEAYADYIVEYSTFTENISKRYPTECILPINDRYAVIYNKREGQWNHGIYSYDMIPGLFGLLDSTNIDSSGVTKIQNNPNLALFGSGILIGFVDTGIDYTHPAFQYSNGKTRIAAIWDQSIQDGTAPEKYGYGSEYLETEINEALASDNPFSVVPTRDIIGHGTFMAGIAAGSEDKANDFIGAAPEATLAMVKLKAPKQYLKDYYYVPEDVPAYQENDIMLGISYLLSISVKEEKPIVICLGLGSNFGSRSGISYLSTYLDMISNYLAVASVVGCGNELGLSHHYRGNILAERAFDDVQIRVAQDEPGVFLELWGSTPDVFSIAVTSPGGEFIPEIPARFGQNQRVKFLLEPTVMYIDYYVIEPASGQFLIVMRFDSPSPGIWTIRVFGNRILDGAFNMWLAMEGFIKSDTFFLKPEPDTTLTVPSAGKSVISVANYNHTNDSLYVHSGRGYPTDGRICPAIAAPGVNIFGPAAGRGNVTEDTSRRYTTRTGSSVAAAHTAGAAALLLEWGIYKDYVPTMDSEDVRIMMIKGARRKADVQYPNRGWGYGSLDVYNAIDVLRV